MRVNAKMKNNTNYVIFGASGDLSRRYLLPAAENLGLNIIKIGRSDYPSLDEKLLKDGEFIFHLAIPGEGVPEAIKLVSKYKNAKVLLEKPFGRDLKSAKALVECEDRYFDEKQIYRVDHYLGKKSLQKVFIEDPDQIAGMEVVASEKIDIEGRASFYERTGALRDFVQSHLLEMAAVALAGSYHPDKRYEALRDLSVVCDIGKHECVKRGQYEGYRAEVGNPGSKTETFVSINLMYQNAVPVVLKTGKALKEKRTQIIARFKDGSEKVFQIEHEPDAYQRVMAAAIAGDKDAFISKEEILESWRILGDIQASWENSDEMVIYPKGSDINEI